MFNQFSTETREYRSLCGGDFKEEYTKSKNAVLIDVRTAGEFAVGTIPEAKNIDVMSSEFNSRISSLDKSKEYFIFCRSGARSAQACSIMAMQGFRVYNLAGGVSAWPH